MFVATAAGNCPVEDEPKVLADDELEVVVVVVVVVAGVVVVSSSGGGSPQLVAKVSERPSVIPKCVVKFFISFPRYNWVTLNN